MKKHWIGSAVKHPGAMTAAAKREGVSNGQFEQDHQDDAGHAGQMARLAMTLKGLRGNSGPSSKAGQ
jgi:hypothetical protein